jgi:hypothetical protein
VENGNRIDHATKLSTVKGNFARPRVVCTKLMKQRTFKNVNNCLNNNIYSYLETSGGQNYNLYSSVVPFFQRQC